MSKYSTLNKSQMKYAERRGIIDSRQARAIFDCRSPKSLEFHDDFACQITNTIPFLVVANIILTFQRKVNVIF